MIIKIRKLLAIAIMIMNPFVGKAQLLPLSKVKGTFINKDFIVIPSMNLKIGDNSKLYYKDSLIFTPTGKFELCIYEVIDDSKIVITAIHPSLVNSSLLFTYAKQEILLLTFLDDIDFYHGNLVGNYIESYNDIKKIICLQNSKKKIKLKKIKTISFKKRGIELSRK